MNQFTIGYMITLHFKLIGCSYNKLKKWSRATFYENIMENIRDVIKNKDTCVIAIIMFYESKGRNPIQVYMVLSCVLYSLIKNYVCIDYIYFQSKKLISISYDRIFEQKSYNILLGIVIPEVLLNLVYCHWFMEKPNSTFILNYWCCLLNNYLSKWLFIIENSSKQ